MQIAILKHHEFTEWRAIQVPSDKTTEMDDRDWLWPFLGTDWHLLAFVNIESIGPSE